MHRMFCLIVLLVALGGCASIAQVEVVDRPNYKQEPFRYVLWKGEKYGPMAFAAAAQKGVSSIALRNPGPDGIRCVAALSGALSVPATLEGSSGTYEPIVPSAEPIQDACSVK